MLSPFWPSISLIGKQWYVEEGSLSPSGFEKCIGGIALEVNHHLRRWWFLLGDDKTYYITWWFAVHKPTYKI